MTSLEVLSRPAHIVPDEDVSLKSLGLAVMSFIVEAIAAEDASLLSPAVESLADYAASLPPKALFSDWSASTGTYTVPLVLDGSFNPDDATKAVDGGSVVCKSSSNNTDRDTAEQALSTNSSSYWSASIDASNSFWEVRLSAPTYVQYAELEWRGEAASKSIPESYTVSISEDGKTWKQVGPATVCDALPRSKMLSQQIAIAAVALCLRVEMKGYAKAVPEGVTSTTVAKEKAHAIKKFQLFVPDTLAVHVAPGTTLYDLEKLLYNAAVGQGDHAQVSKALRGLECLSLASGSLHGLLTLVTALLALAPDSSARDGAVPARFASMGALKALASLDTLPGEVGDMASFARQLDEAANEELEQLLGAKPAAGGSGQLKPEFDSGCCSSGIDLSNDNTYMRTTSGSRTCVYGTHGFTKGRVAWEFRCEIDTLNDEYLCYGCGTKPKDNDSYDGSSNLWMVRGYNGRVYSQGNSGRSVDKVHPNNVVRFELDCDEGSVRMRIDGNDQGIVFEGLKGKEIFPAMCGYGSGRAASFITLQVMGGSSGGAPQSSGGTVLISALPALSSGDEDAKAVSTGHFYSEGQLEEGSGEIHPFITVSGKRRNDGISLRPDAVSGDAATATFPLTMTTSAEDKGKKDDKTTKPYEYFFARVGVDDTSLPAPAVRPVVIAVSLDGREVYASPQLAAPGSTHYLRVNIKDAAKLTLTARFVTSAGTPSSGSAPKTVIYDACVVEQREWNWTARKNGNLPSFADKADGDIAKDGAVPLPSTPLSLARLVLSRLALLSEAHCEAVRKGVTASLKIGRALQLEAGTPVAELISRANASLQSKKTKAHKEKKEDAFTEADVKVLESLGTIRSPFCLDVSAATFSQLRTLVSVALPHVWREGGLGISANYTNDVEEARASATMPWTAIARYVMMLIKSHLKRLVASGVDLATVGILVADPGSQVVEGLDVEPLMSSIKTELAARGDRLSSHHRPFSGPSALMVGSKNAALKTANQVAALFDPSTALSQKESTLAPLHHLLQFVIEDEEPVEGDGKSVRSKLSAAVQSAAADAIDAGLQVLYPTQAERRQLLAGLVAKGAVVEVQFRFPATRPDASKPEEKPDEKKDDKDKKKEKAAEEALERKLSRDPRADRAVLLLELECERLKMPCIVSGQWGHYVHVVVDLPSSSGNQAVEFLDNGFSKIFERAGFGKWTIPTGCIEPFIPLKIERVADFTGSDRSFTGGVGMVHIYPRSAASFDEINTSVQNLVNSYKDSAAAGAGDAKSKMKPKKGAAKA